jgi:hypothetical protein
MPMLPRLPTGNWPLEPRAERAAIRQSALVNRHSTIVNGVSGNSRLSRVGYQQIPVQHPPIYNLKSGIWNRLAACVITTSKVYLIVDFKVAWERPLFSNHPRLGKT